MAGSIPTMTAKGFHLSSPSHGKARVMQSICVAASRFSVESAAAYFGSAGRTPKLFADSVQKSAIVKPLMQGLCWEVLAEAQTGLCGIQVPTKAKAENKNTLFLRTNSTMEVQRTLTPLI